MHRFPLAAARAAIAACVLLATPALAASGTETMPLAAYAPNFPGITLGSGQTATWSHLHVNAMGALLEQLVMGSSTITGAPESMFGAGGPAAVAIVAGGNTATVDSSGNLHISCSNCTSSGGGSSTPTAAAGSSSSNAVPVQDVGGGQLMLHSDVGAAPSGSAPIGGSGLIGWLYSIAKALSGTLTVQYSSPPSVTIGNSTSSPANTQDTNDGAAPSGVTNPGSGSLGWLSGIYKLLSGTLSTTGTVSNTVASPANTQDVNDGAAPSGVTNPGSGSLGWLSGIYKLLSGTLSTTGTVSNTVASPANTQDVNDGAAATGTGAATNGGTGSLGWLSTIAGLLSGNLHAVPATSAGADSTASVTTSATNIGAPGAYKVVTLQPQAAPICFTWSTATLQAPSGTSCAVGFYLGAGQAYTLTTGAIPNSQLRAIAATTTGVSWMLLQ